MSFQTDININININLGDFNKLFYKYLLISGILKEKKSYRRESWSIYPYFKGKRRLMSDQCLNSQQKLRKYIKIQNQKEKRRGKRKKDTPKKKEKF